MLNDDKPLAELSFTESTERFEKIGDQLTSVLVSNGGSMDIGELFTKTYQDTNNWSLAELKIGLTIIHLKRIVEINDRQKIVSIENKPQSF